MPEDDRPIDASQQDLSADEAVSGLPEGIEESAPLGVDEPNPDGEGEAARGEDAQPGIARGEPDVSG